jgi:malonyl-CoA O-methyltransferase
MTLRAQDVLRRFNQAAADFDQFDFVHAVTRDGLFARLEPMLVEATTIVDLGCATGTASKMLARKFRGAEVIAVDRSPAMLRQAIKKKTWRSRFSVMEADAAALPLRDQSVDFVFSNQLLPWVDDVPAVFAEVNRVLRENGLFLFASLGPDSFAELRRAWQTVDQDSHVQHFSDMHNIGDAAVRAGLSDPVLDVDRLNVSYQNTAALFRDLTGSGARNCLAERRRSLTGKNCFAALCEALQNTPSGPSIRLDLELVFGHCWGSGPRARGGEVRIDPQRIGRRR